MTLREAWQLLKQTFWSWSEDRVPSMGAALAYYTMFSVAPLLLIVIAVAGLVFGEAAARGEVFDELRGLMGSSGAHAVQTLLEGLHRSHWGSIGAGIGVVVMLIGASTVLAELQSDLDRIWHVPQRGGAGLVWSTLRSRLLTFALILVAALVVTVSIFLTAALAALGRWWGPVFGHWRDTAYLASAVINLGLLTLVFAMIYKILPRADVQWRDVWIGAAVTAVLFSVGKYLIGVYIAQSTLLSAYAAAGSVVVMMLWVYYSAQVFLLGAEFTWVYANAHGSRRHLRSAGDASPPRERVFVDTHRGSPAMQPIPSARRRPLRAVGIAAALGAIAAAFSRLRGK